MFWKTIPNAADLNRPFCHVGNPAAHIYLAPRHTWRHVSATASFAFLTAKATVSPPGRNQDISFISKKIPVHSFKRVEYLYIYFYIFLLFPFNSKGRKRHLFSNFPSYIYTQIESHKRHPCVNLQSKSEVGETETHNKLI